MDERLEELRKKAYKLLENKPKQEFKNFEKKDLDYLIQELEIYHTELEAQNYELLSKEQELIKANDENEKLFLNAPIPYILIDKKFYIKKANIKALEYFQFYNFHLNEKSFLSILVNKDLENFYIWINKNDFINNPIELSLYTCDRTKILDFKINATILNDENMIMLSLTNIQKEKELIKQLETKDNLLLSHIQLAAQSELLSLISHHWKQPLNVLSCISSSFKMQLDEDILNKDEIKKLIHLHEDTIHTLVENIQEFINLEKIDNHKKIFDKINFIKNLKSLSNKIISTYNIKLIISSDEFKKFYINTIDLLKVIIKIVNNSVEAININSIENGEIQIILKDNIDSLEIQIQDNANGIEQNLLSKVFEPYFSTKSLNNLGLGLFMSKQIIEKELKGKIEVLNSNNGLLTKICVPKKDIDEDELLIISN